MVELHGYCADGGLQVLVYEFAPRRSLHDILHGLLLLLSYFISIYQSTFIGFLCNLTGPQGDYGLTLEPGPSLSWPQRIKIAFGAAKGLYYIHKNGLVHCNIKSSNVLVFDDEVAKISDLHLSTRCSCKGSDVDLPYPFRSPPCFAYHPPEYVVFHEFY